VKVLTLNCGSSTLKFDVMDVRFGDDPVERVAHGAIERIGGKGKARLTCGDEETEREVETQDHRDAFHVAHEMMDASGCLEGLEAVGHRVVHGGTRFLRPILIDDEVIEGIREVSVLAPLHNHPALAVIEASREAFDAETPMIAAFDTTYYVEMPEVATRYAIPREISDRYEIRRFGFHGLAHGYMARRYQELRPEVQRPRLVTLQLGGGCSVTASFDNQPMDTSMGYTPLQGLIMGTRSGNLDPALPLRLQALTGMTADEVESMLNTESGILALSGKSAEMRDLVPASEAGDQDAALAVDAFCASAKKYVGGYLALLGGADAIVFGGGIGENMPAIRRMICQGLQWAGVTLSDDVNEKAEGPETRISDKGSRIEVWVIRVDEAAVIARETVSLLSTR
jgi:acetate kinase